MQRTLFNQRTAVSAASIAMVLVLPVTAAALTFSGTVKFVGTVTIPTPIAGITEDDLTVSSGPGIEATGNGEHCTITSNGSANVDSLGAYPETGDFAVGIDIDHGGMQAPDGNCLVQIQANGNDGGEVSAHGTVTVVVSAIEISGNSTVNADNIIVRQSKTHAGLTKDCLKWVKKEVKFKGKCNYQLWKLGSAGAVKCKNAGTEPTNCDSAGYVDEVVALSFGDMDQQTDPPSAVAVNLDALKDQSKCQRFLGKSAANFFARRNLFVQKRCIAELDDDTQCRDTATNDSKAKLDLIDKCSGSQEIDAGKTIPDVGEPCRTDCITAGVLDKKCLKTCFQLEISTLSDGLIGDVPVCGNGTVQAGEICDDGNLVTGDCCNATCTTASAPGVEAGNCADGVDNDCDGLTDTADPVDCP